MIPTQINSTKKVRRLPVFDDNTQLERFLTDNFTESLKQMIKLVIKTMMKSEMEIFRRQFEEKLHFNGCYDRNMISSWGKIDDIPVPRFRQNNQNINFTPKSLNVFDEEKQKFEKLIEQMHLLGISQRKIKYLSQLCFGIPISKNRVGRIYKELADKEEVNINVQLLSDDFQYIFLDGIWEKTKGYGWDDDNKTVLLCVLGVKQNGERKIIGFTLAHSEDEKAWERLLKSICDRGLKGTNLKLAISDDTQSLKNALLKYYPNIPVQTCIIHKIRAVMFKTKYINRKAVGEDLKTIFASRSKKEAMDKTKTVVRKWYMTETKAMSSLRYNIEYCFTYFDFPEKDWSKIRTNNILEREFREIRRRIKVFDNTFQSEESANRYANSIISYLNQNYPLNYKLHTKS
jgi:transposase-like protein